MGRRWSNYPLELRERAAQMVAQVRPEYPSDWPAICAVAEKLGTGTAETSRTWVRQAEVDAGTRMHDRPCCQPPAAGDLATSVMAQALGGGS